MINKKYWIFAVLLLIGFGCSKDNADPSADYSYNSSIIIRADAGKSSLKQTIIQQLNQSKSSIKCAIRDISDSDVILALKKAHGRHIDVSCVIDAKHMNDSEIIELIMSGITVHGRSYDELMHSSFIIYDDDLAILGIYNLDEVESPFGFTFLVRDLDILKRFICEFAILIKGADSLAKDGDFGYTIGPFDEMLKKNKYYDSSWYTEISLSSGTRKGVWPETDTTLPIETYMLPYQYTDFRYGGWSDDDGDADTDEFDSDGIFDSAYTVRTYNSFASGSPETIYCCDFRNVLIPQMLSAHESITVCALNLTDPLIISSLEKAKESGVKVTTYLDYSFCRQNTSQYPAFKKIAAVSDHFMLVRPEDACLMRGGLMIIDNEMIVVSSSGFSTNAFVSNDGYVFTINDAGIYVKNMEQEFARMKSVSCDWPENDIFSGDCIIYNYIEKY